MFVGVRFVFFLTILDILENGFGLIELPRVEDNNILNAESAIRSTANKLFSSIKLKGVKQNPKLKQYRLIHNYFVSLTIKDYKNLKEIAQLTRVDKKAINDSNENFIDLLNEILNQDSSGFESKSKARGDTFDNEVGHYIDRYSHKVAYLKQTYGDKSPRVDINEDIIKFLEKDKHYFNLTSQTHEENNINSEEDNLLDDGEFWVPDSSFYRRIYHGKRSKIKAFPFMASVQFFNNFQCGGSIISNDLVITAASCLQLAWNNRLFRENPAFLAVRVGSDYYEGGGEMISVLEIYFHPSYNPKNLRNNLAILRLSRKIKFTSKKISRVKKINFDRVDSPLSMTTNGITIIGWGAKSLTNTISNPWENKISFSVLDMYSLQDCQDTYSKEYVSETNFCAGKISKGSGACNKDVGDPGLVYGILTGIVSFGSPVCGTPDAPTVFTKLGFYSDWIEEIMEQESIIPGIKMLTTSTRIAKITLPKATTTKRFNFFTKRTTTLNPDLDPSDYILPLGSLLEPGLESNDKESDMFQKYLKTLFKSKEIDEYIDFNYGKEAEHNNADVIAERQLQMVQNSLDTPPTEPHLPKYEDENKAYKIDKTTTPIKSHIYKDYGSDKDEQEHETDSHEIIMAEIDKLDHDINSDYKIDENPLMDNKINHNELLDNPHTSNNKILSSLLSDIKPEDRKSHPKHTSNFKSDSSKESESQIKESEEIRARHQLEQNIIKLLNSIDLKEKIEQVSEKLERKEKKKRIAHKKRQKDIDDTVLALMDPSSLEKRRDTAAKSHHLNYSPVIRAGSDNIEELIAAESDSIDLSELRLDSHIFQEPQHKLYQQSYNKPVSNKPKPHIENKTLRNHTGVKESNNLFSKQVLFEILSDMIDYHNKNNTIKV